VKMARRINSGFDEWWIDGCPKDEYPDVHAIGWLISINLVYGVAGKQN